MEPREPVRRLVVNADDFGRSRSINEAVIRAHREGILTTASLMVNAGGTAEAVRLAGENPALGVGLHLSLTHARSCLPPARIPGLVNAQSRFSEHPARAGFRYFLSGSLRRQIEDELGAQFAAFRATGIPLDHVNGHLHFHLHPAVFNILARRAKEWGVARFRLTRDPLRLNLQLARGRMGYRLSHALIFSLLSRRAKGTLDRLGIRYPRAVFGLLQNGCVDADYVARLLPRLPPGDSELYSHPSMDEFRHELDALIDPGVRARIRDLGIRLVRYQDL